MRDGVTYFNNDNNQNNIQSWWNCDMEKMRIKNCNARQSFSMIPSFFLKSKYTQISQNYDAPTTISERNTSLMRTYEIVLLSSLLVEPPSTKENNCLNAAKACNLNDTCKKYRSAYINPCTSRVSASEVCNKRKCHKALRQFFDKVIKRVCSQRYLHIFLYLIWLLWHST